MSNFGNDRRQTRYWILRYSSVFEVKEFVNALNTREGLQGIAVYQSVLREKEPETIVFLQFDKAKEYFFYKDNENREVLAGPCELRNPVPPFVQAANGSQGFQQFLNSIKAESINNTKVYKNLVSNDLGNLSLINKADSILFETFDVDTFKTMGFEELNQFLYSFNSYFTETVKRTTIAFDLLDSAIYYFASDKNLFDQLLIFIAKRKNDIEFINFYQNKALKVFQSNESRLEREMDLKKQNKRALDKQEKEIRSKVKEEKEKEEQTKSEKLNEALQIGSFNFSNTQYSELEKQIMKDDYKNINYNDIFKIDRQIFKNFFLPLTYLAGDLGSFKKNNNVYRFLELEFGSRRFKSNDKPIWFSELYPYLPTPIQEKYKKHLR